MLVLKVEFMDPGRASINLLLQSLVCCFLRSYRYSSEQRQVNREECLVLLIPLIL